MIFPVKTGFLVVQGAKFQPAIIQATGNHAHNAQCLTLVKFNNHLIVFYSIVGRPAITEIIKLFFGWIAEVVEAYQCLTVFKKADKTIGVFSPNVYCIG